MLKMMKTEYQKYKSVVNVLINGYNISTEAKEGATMNYEEKIISIGMKNNGYICHTDLTAEKIPTMYLSKLLKKEVIQRIETGIYILNDFIEDDFFTYHLKYSKLIYSRISALYLNDLYNKQLEHLEGNFPYSYNVSKINNIRCHPICDRKYQLGLIFVKTPAGNYVKSYDKERCICDLFVYEDLDNEGLRFAIDKYRQFGVNHDKLYEYAKVLGVYKEIKAIFEVI